MAETLEGRQQLGFGAPTDLGSGTAVFADTHMRRIVAVCRPTLQALELRYSKNEGAGALTYWAEALGGEGMPVLARLCLTERTGTLSVDTMFSRLCCRVAGALGQGKAPALQQFTLDYVMDERSCTPLTAAFASGALDGLRELTMDALGWRCEILTTLFEAIGKGPGRLPELRSIALLNMDSYDGIEAFLGEMLAGGAMPQLETLRINVENSLDEGEAMCKALGPNGTATCRATLTELDIEWDDNKPEMEGFS